ncbi:assimilatory nitrate reductase catalytic subunit [Variovorax paradoxus]|uniref:nitrate reductase n=1 Tax=Variovorax paradoxus TaxID=34073 RepID=UPI00278B245E|nr:nitrate reductase [Variovorax paradoxus]MDQ0024593.1 assimilatory nitrate reductase catalytic subunit [Variovorax paradoxus]
MEETRSTCPYCGVGCGVIIESDGAQITGVRGDPDHPANFGRLCTKGSTLHLTATATVTRQTRLLQPMRRALRGGEPAPITWDAALGGAVDKFEQVIRDHGPDAVGFYVSGQLLTEDYYVFNKLAKGLIGTNNIDTNSRLCMSSAVAGYKQTLGADAPPACYDDLKHAECLFIVGSNAAWAHPILFRRIEDAKAANPGMKIIVADPRRTDTVEIADLFLPIQPGTDVMLFNGMLHLMLWEGWTDNGYIAAHTNGFDALKATVRECTPDKVAQICGISKEDLLAAARMFATSPATLSLYCQGLNQSSSGTAKNAALINLHLATGQIGKPGAGPFSLTGQPNAMGGREVGGLANLLSAHRDLANPAHRAEVAALWNLPSVPEKPGKTAVEMFQAAADGEIRALWIACTNPAQSMPDQATVRRALERAEFVVVQEAFSTTSTCAFADLLLPATTWGEKEGTVTNSERRISRVRPAVPAPGEARHDWSIAVDFARRLEQRLGRTATLFPYESAERVWNEHRESTRGRDLDITGMSYAMLDTAGPQQWPLKEGETTGRVRLYEDGIFPTPDGRARFADTVYKPVAEAREARYPFSLNTGRLRDQWHGMSRTGTVGRLFGHVAEPVVQMNAQDMARRQLNEGDLVHLTSKRGSILLPARASAEIGLSQAFVAMHWGEEYLSGCSSTGTPLAGINALTSPAYCPTSKQPELKHTPVKILKAELPWSLLAMAWLPPETALAAHQALKPLMAMFPFATCVPFSGNTPGEERSGILFRAAAHDAPADELIDRIEGLLGLVGSDALRYADRRRGQRRVARLVRRADGNAGLEAFLLGGDTSAEAWIGTLLREEIPAQTYGRLLLSPGARAPVAVQSRGQPVCTCFNVTDLAIRAELGRCSGTPEERLASLQGALKCGTNCGSCLPELKRMVRATPAETAVEGA